MAPSENSVRVCVFCYRSSNHSIKELAESTNFYLFLKLVDRFNGDKAAKLEKQMQLSLLDGLSLSDTLGCCEGCISLVNEFCNIYHQFKCLEMKLEWEIDKLVSIIKLANRVPSRVAGVIRALQVQQTENGNRQVDQEANEKLKVIRKFRHGFAKQCRQRLTKSQPRILMSRNHAILTRQPQAKENFLEQSFIKDTIPELDDQLIAEPKKTTTETVDPISISDLEEVDPQMLASSDPKAFVELNEDNTCQEDFANKQNDVLDDNDSASSHDDDDDPMNNDTFFGDDEIEENDIASIKNSNNCTGLLTQTKLEFPQITTQEESDTQIETQTVPQSASSHIIENVFSTLPLPFSEVLTGCLNKHIQSDHTETPSACIVQEPINIKTEALNKSSNPSFIETCLKNANIKPVITTPTQQRYSMRKRKSTETFLKLEEIDSENDNDMNLTEEKGCSSSNSSDTEEDISKPIKTSSEPKPVKTTKIKPEKSNIIRYTNCKICNKRTTNKVLSTHLKLWHDTTNLDETEIIKCNSPNCRAYFRSKEQLQFHNRHEHKSIFRCHICQKTFTVQLLHNRHLRRDHGKTHKNPIRCLEERQVKPTEFKCNFCEFVTISPTKLAIHETEHALPLSDDIPNGKLQRCPRCPYKYAKRMQRHYVTHHLRNHLNYLTGESSSACGMCSKGKAYVENTKHHFDTQHNTDLLEDPTQVYKCDECPAYYLKSFQLHRHKIRIHPSKTCDVCGKTFYSRHTLNSHMKITHREQESNPALPVPCDWPNCVKRFGTEAELEFHKIYTHKRNPEEKKGSVICETCGRGFKSTALLRLHMERIHVEKIWVCGDCGKTFKMKKAFETHMQYHKGPESWKFECEVCGKKCLDKWKLASHMNTHTKEKPYICQFCGEKYAHRHNWKNHLKVKHMDEEGVEEIVNGKKSQRKGNYLSRKGTKKGDCIMASDVK